MQDREVYIYGDIWEYSALEFVKSVEEAKGFNLVARINTNGGDPTYMWGMAAKFAEHKGKKIVKVDGKAHSSGFYFLLFADEVQAIEESDFVIHRAAYPSWIENDKDRFTDNLKQNLNDINGKLRASIESKLDYKKLEKIKGVTLDQIFSLESRIDVKLTSSEALDIGLIDKIVKIGQKEKAMIDARYSIAARSEEKKEEKPKQAKKMTLDALKAEHPDLFAQVFNLGVAKEKDRVGAWATYIQADPEAVAKGIKEGADLSATTTAELNMKMFQKVQMKTLENESPKAVTTPEAPKAKTEDETKAEAFFNEIMPK